MSVTQISISEIQRNLHKLDDFEIVEVVDKKRNIIKGYFIESKYAALVKEIAQMVKRDRNSSSTAAGILHRYAQPGKIANEKGAWREHVIARYTGEQEV